MKTLVTRDFFWGNFFFKPFSLSWKHRHLCCFFLLSFDSLVFCQVMRQNSRIIFDNCLKLHVLASQCGEWKSVCLQWVHVQQFWSSGTSLKENTVSVCMAVLVHWNLKVKVSRAKYQFRLRNSSWLFCSDSPEWRRRHMVMWFGHHGDAFGTTENAFFRAFITLRSQFHLHHRSQRALTEIMSKITPNLGLVL